MKLLSPSHSAQGQYTLLCLKKKKKKQKSMQIFKFSQLKL